MEKRADFEIFFIDFHRKGNLMQVRAVVSNIGSADGNCEVNCYVKNTATDVAVTVSTQKSELLKAGKSCTVSLEFSDSDIAEKTPNYVLLKAGEYIVSLGENEQTSFEVYSFTMNEDRFL